jgi:glucokinase
MILAGDIGGTKCNLSLLTPTDDGKLSTVFQRRYATRDFQSFEGLIERFRSDAIDVVAMRSRFTAAGLGVAGAVVDGRLYANNLPWTLDARALAQKLNLDLEHVVLLNDVVATATSIDILPQRDLGVLNPGVAQPRATRALIAVGTGLGEALLLWDEKGYRVAPSEGGLADFAPRTDREIRLLMHLKREFAHVCCEEVLSGRGIRAIHEFLDPAVRHPSLNGSGGDPTREISTLALSNSCPVCVETLDLWTEAYGSEAGNLAVRVLAFGGIYLAGGIAPKIFSKLTDGSFLRGFCDKAKLSPVLSKIPIHVILNEDAPMLGAAYSAWGHVRAQQLAKPQRKAG